MTFTAIDFETANERRSSACAVGMTVVEDGQIVDEIYHLIRPNPTYFAPINVSIHGITSRDVAGAPTFAQLWPELMDRVAGPLVAHNAAFDMSVVRQALDASGLPYPETDYFCTVVIAKLTWPQHDSYKLNHLAQWLNIPLRHHDAAEDARACAMVALEACQSHGVESLYDLREPCGLRVGSLCRDGYTPCGVRRRKG